MLVTCVDRIGSVASVVANTILAFVSTVKTVARLMRNARVVLSKGQCHLIPRQSLIDLQHYL